LMVFLSYNLMDFTHCYTVFWPQQSFTGAVAVVETSQATAIAHA